MHQTTRIEVGEDLEVEDKEVEDKEAEDMETLMED